MTQTPRKLSGLLPCAIGIILLLVVYGGTYRMCMTPVRFHSDRRERKAVVLMVQMQPDYPAGWLAQLFAPIHWIDRQIRSEFWSLQEHRISDDEATWSLPY